MKNTKLKFSEYMQNISRSKSFGKFVLIVQRAVPSSSFSVFIIIGIYNFGKQCANLRANFIMVMNHCEKLLFGALCFAEASAIERVIRSSGK